MTVVEDAETAAWRSRCTDEMHRLREALATTRPTNVVIWNEATTDYPRATVEIYNGMQEITLCFVSTKDTVDVFSFPGYPCIAAHLKHYGDKQLFRLLEGHADDLETLGYGVDVNREWLLAILDMQLTPPPPEHR